MYDSSGEEEVWTDIEDESATGNLANTLGGSLTIRRFFRKSWHCMDAYRYG
jgi:hypothetical protein